MTRSDLTSTEMGFLAFGVLLLLIAWCVRIRIFFKFSDTPPISHALSDTYPTTVYDFLSIVLYRMRRDVSTRARRMIILFATFEWLAWIVLILTTTSALMRRWE